MPIMLHKLAIMLQKYTIMLLSKIIYLGHVNTFSHRTVTKHIERLQNSRIELLLEAKCQQLVTLVVLQYQRCLNVVLEHTILTLQPGLLHSSIFSHRVTWKLCMRNMRGATNYASIMLDALKGQLCSKLCRHNICMHP